MKKDTPAFRYARRDQAVIFFLALYLFFVMPVVVVLGVVGFTVAGWVFVPLFVLYPIGSIWVLLVKCPDCGMRISDFWGRWPPQQMPHTHCKKCGRSTALPYED